MKKLFLLTILTACFTASYAQDKNFGFYGGANYSYFTNNPKSIAGANKLEQEGLLGFHFGILGQKRISSDFSFNGALGFSQKGAKYSEINLGHLLRYVNLAVNARLDFKRFFVESGPEIGFLADSRIIENGKATKPIFDIFNQKIDVLVNVGIGVWITKTTSLSLRFSKGFLGTSEFNFTDENGNLTGTAKVDKNLSYQLSLCQMVF